MFDVVWHATLTCGRMERGWTPIPVLQVHLAFAQQMPCSKGPGQAHGQRRRDSRACAAQNDQNDQDVQKASKGIKRPQGAKDVQKMCKMPLPHGACSHIGQFTDAGAPLGLMLWTILRSRFLMNRTTCKKLPNVNIVSRRCISQQPVHSELIQP